MLSSWFALGDNAVVARAAAAIHLSVVHVPIGPALGRVVAGITIVGGAGMRRCLARGSCPVVATRAICPDIVVVKTRGKPGAGPMAVRTLRCRRNVGRRFAGRRDTIVTA